MGRAFPSRPPPRPRERAALRSPLLPHQPGHHSHTVRCGSTPLPPDRGPASLPGDLATRPATQFQAGAPHRRPPPRSGVSPGPPSLPAPQRSARGLEHGHRTQLAVSAPFWGTALGDPAAPHLCPHLVRTPWAGGMGLGTSKHPREVPAPRRLSAPGASRRHLHAPSARTDPPPALGTAPDRRARERSAVALNSKSRAGSSSRDL